MTSILDRTGKTPDTLSEYGGNAAGTAGPGTSTQAPADWDATTGVSRILNKPNISEVAVDAIAAALAAGTHVGIAFSYDDAGNKISAIVGPSGPAGTNATNLTVAARGAATLDIASDTGTDATVPAATTALAGLMSAADKAKLDGLGASSGGAPIARSIAVAANAKAGTVVVAGFGTSTDLAAITATVSATGDMVTIGNVGSFKVQSVTTHYPDGFNTGTSFTAAFPDPMGAANLDAHPLGTMMHFAGSPATEQPQTYISCALTGGVLSLSRSNLVAGVAARFRAEI